MKKDDKILPLRVSGRDTFLSLPFLVKGKIEFPPDIDPELIRDSFSRTAAKNNQPPSSVTYTKLSNAQAIREPITNRKGSHGEDAYFYQVMPKIDPVQVGYFEPLSVVNELYSLPFSDVLSYLSKLSQILSDDSPLTSNIREIASISSSIPAGFFNVAYRTFGKILDPHVAALMADNGLAYLGHSGREFLDGWVRIPLQIEKGASMLAAKKIFHNSSLSSDSEICRVRAMPTRQLHITAGNAPGIPFVSAARAFTTKSASLIKMPYGVTLPGALLALGMVKASAEHPLTKNTSIVYWSGGDEEVESIFYQQDFFDRIVVWGAPNAVSNVKKKSLFTKVLTFNPRYGISLIGNEVFPNNVEEAAIKASTDSMIWNQKACIASLVHYVEGSENDALKYCETLAGVMKKWDEEIPNVTPPMIEGQIRRMRRGKLMGAKWFTNQSSGHFQSAVVYVPGEFDMMDHPMWRLIVVRRVNDLIDCLKYLHSSISTVGIYPEHRRDELRDRVAACGVSNIVELGKSERLIPGSPHDGLMVFSELVDWKNA